MLHAKQVDETRINRKNRYAKRERFYDGGASKGRLEIQDKPKFKKRFSNQVPTKFSNTSKDRVSNPSPQVEESLSKKPTCTKCDKKYMGECLGGMGN